MIWNFYVLIGSDNKGGQSTQQQNYKDNMILMTIFYFISVNVFSLSE